MRSRRCSNSTRARRRRGSCRCRWREPQETPPGGLDTLGDGFDRLDLIGAIDDAFKRHLARERLPKLIEMGESQQVFLGEESADLPRVEASMPEPDFVPVGQEHEGVRAVPGRVARRRSRQPGVRLREDFGWNVWLRQWQAVGRDDPIARSQRTRSWCGNCRLAVQHGGSLDKELFDHPPAAYGPAGVTELKVDPFLTCLTFRVHRLEQPGCCVSGSISKNICRSSLLSRSTIKGVRESSLHKKAHQCRYVD